MHTQMQTQYFSICSPCGAKVETEGIRCTHRCRLSTFLYAHLVELKWKLRAIQIVSVLLLLLLFFLHITTILNIDSRIRTYIRLSVFSLMSFRISEEMSFIRITGNEFCILL